MKAPELGTQEGTDEGPHGQERKDIKEERSRFRNHDDGIPALCPAAHGLKCSLGQALRAGKALLPGAGSGLARCNEQGSADRVLAVTRKEHSHRDKALPPGLREAHSRPPLEAGIFGLRKLTTLPRHGSYAKRFRTQTVHGSLGEDWPCRWLLLSLGVGDQALYLRLKQL